MFETTVEQTKELVKTGDLLTILSTQVNNYPEMFNFLKTSIGNPATILVPQNLKLLDGEMTRNSAFLYEAINFLDVVCMFSSQETGDPFTLYNLAIDWLVDTRTVTDHSLVLCKSEMDNIIYKDGDSVVTLIENNKSIISFYLFSMICTSFFIKSIEV